MYDSMPKINENHDLFVVYLANSTLARAEALHGALLQA
jgi:hypothetical protein